MALTVCATVVLPGMLGCAHDSNPRPAFSDPTIAAAQPRARARVEPAPMVKVAAVQSRLSLDAPIEEIADSTNGCALLDRDFPGLRDHPMYSSFKSMSLNQVAALSGGKITPGMLAQAQSDLAALQP